jgi:GNAT superfamily N-acetyltransferase
MRLREQAGWNQTPEDWQRLLAWEPGGCFVAERDGQVVGTVTTTVYGTRLGWVGMLLVDSAVRRQGVGRALLAHALDWLEKVRGARTSALDATPLGKTLYDGMGFADQFSLQRYEGTAPPAAHAPAMSGLRLPGANDLPALAALDAAVFGADRSHVLQSLIEAHPSHCHLLERDGAVQGYVCARPGARTWYVGPLVAANRAAAETLLRAALSLLAGQTVALDVPDGNEDAVPLVGQFGLQPQRPLIRMARGAPLPPMDIQRCYAIAGPEIG